MDNSKIIVDFKHYKELHSKLDTLNKGIDELIEKYEDETLLLHKDTNCHDYGYYLALNRVLKDLKKLKGE